MAASERETVATVEAVVSALGPSVEENSALVRGHLDAFPDHRRELAEAVETSMVRVDWGLVNEGRADGLSIVYAFTPWNATSGLVAARRARERGEVSDVICNSLGGKREMDPTSNVIAEPWVARQRVVDSPPHFTSWRAVADFSRGVFAELEDLGTAGTYRTLYSRATWAASHVAAAQYKIRHPEVRWTAEMSDPLSRTITGDVRVALMRRGPIVKELRGGLLGAGVRPPEELRLFEWTEYLPYALADEIVFTNAHQLEFMMSYLDDRELERRVRSVATIAPHPTPPRHLYDAEPTEYDLDPTRVNLAYFGVFYATRGLTEVTSALASLPPEARARVALHVFSNKPDAVREDVEAAGLADVVVVNAYRPYLGFLNLTTKFDVLVVNDSDTTATHAGINPYLPSKVSDYRGSGTPVWGVYEQDSVLSTLTLDHRTALGDVSSAVTVLLDLVDGKFPTRTGEAR